MYLKKEAKKELYRGELNARSTLILFSRVLLQTKASKDDWERYVNEPENFFCGKKKREKEKELPDFERVVEQRWFFFHGRSSFFPPYTHIFVFVFDHERWIPVARAQMVIRPNSNTALGIYIFPQTGRDIFQYIYTTRHYTHSRSHRPSMPEKKTHIHWYIYM